MVARLTVVVPVRDEQLLLPACLGSLVVTPPSLRLRIAVVANGCSDGSVAVAESFVLKARARGHELLVLELSTPGKAAALDAANPLLGGCPTVYLDADCVLLPGTLESLHRALTAASGPMLAAPPLVVDPPDSRLTRDFLAVWSRLPAVTGDVIGAGCYAVNAAGRARWRRFPSVIADDLFVRGLFAPDERVVVPAGGFVVAFPEGSELVSVVRRWRRGNRQLPHAVPGWAWTPRPISHRDRLRPLSPDVWVNLPGFALVSLAARIPPVGRARASAAGWARADRARQRKAARGGAPR
jgi:hypothetical protein